MYNRMSLIPTQRSPMVKMTHSLIQRKKQPTNLIPSMTTMPMPNSTQIHSIDSSKIKWKDIMKISIDLYLKTNNLSMIQDNLSNIVSSNLTEEDITSVPESNLVKLIKIYQHTINILLSSKIAIENSYIALEQQYNDLKNNTVYNNECFQNNKDLIKTLNKQNKDNEKMISTYKAIISCLQREKEKESKSSIDQSKQNEDVDCAKKTFFCHYCTGKKFYTEEELRNHLLKRHLITDNGSRVKESINTNNSKSMSISHGEDKESIEVFDKKIIELKSHFDDYFVHLKSEGKMMYLDNQRKIEEERQNKQLDYIEKKFEETLNEIKAYYLQSSFSRPQPVIIQHQYITNKDGQSNEIISGAIRNEFEKLENNIDYISSRTNKINEVEKEVNENNK